MSGDRPQLKTDSLVGGIAMLLALTVAQRLIGFARSVLFCRWLDSDQLGQWDLAYGFLMLAAPLAVLGLPGSLGRYAEYYRQRGRIRFFLRQMGAATGLLAALTVAIVVWRREWFSDLLFNSREQAGLVAVLAVVLATWILHTVLVALFNALRLTRVVSSLQFCHSVGFAVIGVALLLVFEANTLGVLWSFAGASLLSSAVGVVWLARSWGCLPLVPTDPVHESTAESPAPHDEARSMWRQVLPFALWVWVANALANTFGLADRWMLIHFGGLSEPEALVQLGQYHSARVVPMLFLGLAEMLAGLVTPHLAHDWEAGRRDDVSHRLNFILKLFALCLFAGSIVLMLASPLLFGVALAGKYATGMTLLPWTLTYFIWGSLAVVATNYLWCAERARLASFALLVGLIVNVSLSAWLLPRYGLSGAVWATSAANFTMLALMYASAWSCGMRFDRGVCLSALAPIALIGGLGTSLSMLLLLVLAFCHESLLFTPEERQSLTSVVRRWTRRPGRRPSPTMPTATLPVTK
ncbi:MAG TPA: lipopolysaccharide biosynthesis protein [Pirellulales bacterium]|nr:lipopolysaccharide biosynthesis protein [Pirellulales bacterium]